MPIYEFKCQQCNHQFEAMVRRVGAVPDGCPSCEGSKLERLFSVPTVSTAKLRDRNIDERNKRVDAKRRERKGDQIAFERDYHKNHD